MKDINPIWLAIGIVSIVVLVRYSPFDVTGLVVVGGIAALIVALYLYMKHRPRCHACRKVIDRQATKCPYCHSQIS